MGARILVQSGMAAGTCLWIERSVIRIGSDPSADLSLPHVDLAPHAVTVEFRDNAYRVYNRSGQHVFLGGQALEGNSYDEWLDSDLLELPDGIQLALEMDDDPRPGPQQHSATAPTVATESEPPGPLRLAAEGGSPGSGSQSTPSSTTAGKSSNSPIGFQLVVIVLCVLGSALLLVRHNLRGGSSASLAPPPKFAALIEQARKPDEHVSPQLIAQLQYAEAQLVRRDTRRAHERYHRLHEALLRGNQLASAPRSQPAVAADSPPTLRQQIMHFVEYRLQQLSRN